MPHGASARPALSPARSSCLPLGPLGAEVRGGPTTRFALHASSCQRAYVRLFSDPETPSATLPMHARGDGFFELFAEDVGHGALYKFILDDRELPDPYARFLPHGVHGPAAVHQLRYQWRHGAGLFRPLREQLFYELHVGTFTPEGTYRAARERLPALAALGVTTLELMPIAAFAGQRGWGYDGVALRAPFAPYGTPDDLCAFIDEAHRHGLAVVLDAVFNHLGPAGNYLSAYSPTYFTSAIRNAWGDALDY